MLSVLRGQLFMLCGAIFEGREDSYSHLLLCLMVLRI